jgi:VWFA-related protein
MFVLTLLFVLTMVTSALMPAQSGRRPQPAPPTSDGAKADQDVVTLGTTEVVVPVTVRNRYGRPIPGLTKSDFTLFEDGVRQEITGFASEAVPANLVMLIDVSGSVRVAINDIRLSALALINELGERDRVCIMQFNDRILVIQDWTSDKLRLQRALLQLPATGATAFYNALYEAATKKLAGVQGRRAIVLFTDGVDTYQGRDAKTANQALEAIQRAEASVYVISKTKAIREYLLGQRAPTIFRPIDPNAPYIQQYIYALE